MDITIKGIQIPQVHNTKFLGVMIDDELNWGMHINQVCERLRVNKHLLQLSQNFLDYTSLKAVYNAHINSHLTYSLVIWGSMLSKAQTKDLFKIQKSYMSIMHKKSPRTNYNPLFQNSKTLPVQKLINLELMKFGHKITNKLVPEPLKRMMHRNRGHKRHEYNTHNKNLPNIQKHQSSYFNKGFLNRSVICYQSLPKHLKQCKTLRAFTNLVKTLLQTTSTN